MTLRSTGRAQLRKRDVSESRIQSCLRWPLWRPFLAAAALSATGPSRADEPQVDFNAPIEDAVLDTATAERMCADLHSGTPQQQYDAARYSLAQSKNGFTNPALMPCLLHSVENGVVQPIQAHAGFALAAYAAAAVPGLLDIMKRHREDNAYWMASSMLRTLGPAAGGAQETMLQWMNDDTAAASLRLDAARIVWAIDDQKSRDEAFMVILRLSDAEDPEIAASAAIAAAESDRPEAVPTLVRCVRRPNKPFWTEACILALANLAAGPEGTENQAKARSALASLRDDSDPAIRDFAESVSEWIEW